MHEVIYIDGEFIKKPDAKVSVFDHGFLYGDGVFEGIRIYSKKVLRLEAHVDRLYASAKAIGLQIPVEKSEMQRIVLETARKNGLTDGYVRLIVSRGVGDLGIDPRTCKKASIVCIAASIVLYPAELYISGLAVATASQRRSKATNLDPQIKSLNYLNNILAKMEAARLGLNEAIMLNEDGLVAECTGDNVFIVKDGAILTPPSYVGLLCGITRQIFIELAKTLRYELSEQPFTLFNLYDADECFLTGTAAEAIPVVMVDGRTIGSGRPGPVTLNLLNAFKDFVKENGVAL